MNQEACADKHRFVFHSRGIGTNHKLYRCVCTVCGHYDHSLNLGRANDALFESAFEKGRPLRAVRARGASGDQPAQPTRNSPQDGQKE